ncbi:MAG: 5-guanidino-2-oxopentanoate decarboxylase [Gammaproteobacteria bacterium]|nr:5-guanidino-2-oxopentanoate decarboxylase [Gammaproteobacteria bacterium]
MNNPSCGQALVPLLESYGVKHVFGIPGVHTTELYRGLGDSKIKHILVRHEQGAGFMADGYARASGEPGVCFIITGPGMTNIATPIGQAFSDSVPMLVISTVNESHVLGKGYGRLHEITDQAAVTRPLTGFTHTVRDASDLQIAIHRAFDAFNSKRPRPVHIEIPLDVIMQPVTKSYASKIPVQPVQANEQDIDRVTDLTNKAKQIAIIIGGGARLAGESIVGIAEKLNAVMVTTIAGKGAVADDHPLYLGTTLPQSATQDLLKKADVVLSLGSELAETDVWREQLKFDGILVRVDIDPDELEDDRFSDCIKIESDAKSFVERLNATLSDANSQGELEISQQCVASIRHELVEADDDLRKKHRKVLEIVRDALPADAIVATDMTQIAYAGNEIFPTSVSDRWLHPIGYGTLGYALPAAIGAKLARPKTPVAALVGDAGFLFTVQELATAAEHELPIIVLLWNNDSLGQIRDDMEAKNIPPIGVKGRNPDFMALADAFGCDAIQPNSAEGLTKAIKAAIQANAPTIIEIREDAEFLEQG